VQGVIEALGAAIGHHQAARYAEAGQIYQRILARDARQPDALFFYGLLSLSVGRPEQAVALLERAHHARPRHALTLVNLSRARLCVSRPEGAVSAARAALSLASTPMAWRTLASACLAAHQPATALEAADAALAEEQDAEGWFLRGTALSHLARKQDAVVALRRAVALDPSHASAHLNLGNALADLNELEAAEQQMRSAIAANPALAEAHASLGSLLITCARPAEAVAACAEAVALRPDFAEARWNIGIAHLLLGEWERGWEEYEWRKRHPRFAACFSRGEAPEWRGEDPAGRVVLVRAEQGAGDTIQFARYLPLLAERGARVVLECAPQLLPLLRSLPSVSEAIAKGAALPAHDWWIDQMSLPRLFGTRPDTVPASAGFLQADPARLGQWQARLPSGPRVGLVWAGNSLHPDDARRSMTLASLAPVLATEGVSFVSLQVGREVPSQAPLYDASPYLIDYAETAAAVSALDLLVAVDTSVAHLAGALGRPCWLSLPDAPDWRWLLGRNDTPWYGSLRLFRQSSPGDWDGVAVQVARSLRSALKAGAFSGG
jgi:tetratricopeptide (TPR) repeat protein